MSGLNVWYDNLNRHLTERQESEAEFARIAGMTVEEYDADTTAPDPRGDDVLVLEQCPLCDRYVGWIERTDSGHWGHGLVYRYDLRGFICTDCANELGPDEPRVHCLMLGGRTREEALAMLEGDR